MTLASSTSSATTTHPSSVTVETKVPSEYLVTKPPQAHLEDISTNDVKRGALPSTPTRRTSSSSHLSTNSQAWRPSYLEAYTRPSNAPATSISTSYASRPDLAPPSRPIASALGVGVGSNAAATAAELRAKGRTRSMSAGSLKSVLERDSKRGGSSSVDSPVEEHRQVGEAVSELSWSNKWWPFSVLEPAESSKADSTSSYEEADADGAGLRRSTSVDTSHEASRSFLSLLAGKRTAEQVAAEREANRQRDETEQRLLNADLGDLVSMSKTTPSDNDPQGTKTSQSGQVQEHAAAASNNPKRSTSFLPTSIFSSTSAAASSALEGPAALLSSLSLNPFASSSPPKQKLGQARAFSTASSRRKSNDPHDPSNASIPPSESTDAQTGEQSESKRRRKVNPLLDEEDQANSKKEAEQDLSMFHLLKERYDTPKLPLVYAHGLFGADVFGPPGIKTLQVDYWVGVKEALEAMGVEVLIGRVPASASIEERAKVLCELIENTFPGREINLIGHSMGGLDGRFLISRLQPTTFKVRSLTTISTPHRGSTFADFLLEDVLGAERVPALLGLMSTLGVPGGGRAFDNLTTTNMAKFNDETPDKEGVRYFSFGAQFEAGWSNPFRVPWGIIAEREGPNDGLVSVESSKWGEYIATLENVNHLDLIGWEGPLRYKWAEWTGKPIKFKAISFYCAIAEMLAHEGL